MAPFSFPKRIAAGRLMGVGEVRKRVAAVGRVDGRGGVLAHVQPGHQPLCRLAVTAVGHVGKGHDDRSIGHLNRRQQVRRCIRRTSVWAPSTAGKAGLP